MITEILKRVGKGVTSSLGINFSDIPLSPDYYQNQMWGSGETDEGGQRKGVYTDAFWLAPPYGRPRDINYDELEPLETSVWVRMCVQHIVDSIVGADWDIIPVDAGEDIAKEDDAAINAARDFFSARSWQDSFGQVLRQCLPDMINYDCGAIIKVFPIKAYDKYRDIKREVPPLELTAVDGRSILKDADLFKNLRGYWQYAWINPQGVPIHFKKDELIYLQQAPSAREPYGISNLEVIRDVLDYMTDSTLAQSKYWKNGLFIGGQIDLPDVTDLTELKRMQAYYEAKLRGPRKYNKWIITGGGAKVQSMPFTSQEMQWLDSQKWFAKMVFAVYKLTPSELGFTEDLNRATGIQQMQIHKSKGVRPVLLILQEALNREIVWKHFSPKIQFVFNKELDLDDESKQTDIDVKRLQAGLDSVNELRDRDGKPKWEDEVYDGPDATGAKQQQQMEAQQQGDEGETDWGSLFGSNESMPWDEADEDAKNTEKAVMASTPSGSPGYATIPTIFDGKGKPLKTKEEEDKALETVMGVFAEMRLNYKRALDELLVSSGAAAVKGE